MVLSEALGPKPSLQEAMHNVHKDGQTMHGHTHTMAMHNVHKDGETMHGRTHTGWQCTMFTRTVHKDGQTMHTPAEDGQHLLINVKNLVFMNSKH
mgnify:CR=1 FL=1